MRPPIYRIAREQDNMRLAGIDAAERWQAFGDRSRKSLAELVIRPGDVELAQKKTATVAWWVL
jgi:endonuclease YncB( thermonuclease family)